MTGTPPIRLILHVGLHKSGTSTFQLAMRAAYGTPTDGVWFPLMDPPDLGHELVAWTLRGTLHDRLRRHTGDDDAPGIAPVHLRSLVSRAADMGVEALVVSTEELDDLDEVAAAALRAEIGPAPTTVLLTVTPPAHRWYANWQESIKHGAIRRPLDDVPANAQRSMTAPGLLARQISLLPSDDVLVRLVRPSPPERDLVQSLLTACGLDPVATLDVPGPANVGMGADIELMRRLNALGITAKVGVAERLERHATFKAAVRRVPRAGAVHPGYGLPHWFDDAARDELQLLHELGRRDQVRLVDPHRLLERWTEAKVPDWIRAIEQSDWPEVPDADLSRPS
jgi:hypothetical protein